VTRYQKRISGPLMDRIDIHMQVPRVEYQKLRDMRPAQVRKYCALDDPCQALMKTAIRQLQLTA
jgi:magnesium chelatase family protein